MRRARVDLRLPAAQKVYWQTWCAFRGIDLSELIREATDQEIKRRMRAEERKSADG